MVMEREITDKPTKETYYRVTIEKRIRIKSIKLKRKPFFRFLRIERRSGKCVRPGSIFERNRPIPNLNFAPSFAANFSTCASNRKID